MHDPVDQTDTECAINLFLADTSLVANGSRRGSIADVVYYSAKMLEHMMPDFEEPENISVDIRIVHLLWEIRKCTRYISSKRRLANG